ncbi:hypothetical protein LUZ62_047948 [Rhynchospora pubera]|uniref:SMP domain-containing protein n=1 Tax=Rhynchospora pubera TaxID=906938 RepID=A0AAV8FTW9_9POAL|nr:hypothetical protein LUZ62_047948 [Rhynchospora pubera]
MSQGQPRRPTNDQGVKYGDVFDVKGDLAGQTIAPQDAALMQSAETMVLGQTQRGGPAAVMQSASRQNELTGFVGHDQAGRAAANHGVTVTETIVPGGCIVTEFIAGQPIGRIMETDAPRQHVPEGAKITIGEALETAGLTAGDKPVERSDAAAIQAAEARATGRNATVPGGVSAQALAAADANARETCDEDKTKLRDILANATTKMPSDKAVDRDDAARVVGAEIRNKPDMTTRPGGVAASVAAAARLNQDRQ